MFLQPRQVAEALEARAKYGAEITPLGGGTDIVVVLNRQSTGPRHFLDLSRLENYAAIRRENGCYVAGGGATFAQLGRLEVKALSQAAMTVGGAAIRNAGTIAGNLGTASPAGDGCVALLAIDADIELSHATRGRRVIPIHEYFTGFRRTALVADELITAVRFPADWRTAWYKIGKRGSINISIVCCAIGMSPRGDVRIAFGCVAPTVMRARQAEAIIAKDGLADASIEAAAQSAMKEVAPIDDHRSSASYRRAMCGVLTRRLLRELRQDAPRAAGRAE